MLYCRPTIQQRAQWLSCKRLTLSNWTFMPLLFTSSKVLYML